jgi:hypothetical protein
VSHRDRGGGVSGGHGGECLPDVGGGQVAEFPGADDGQDGLEDVLVLLDGLERSALEPVGQPVVGGLADGVVGVAGLRGDALVELVVQIAELVDDGGFGGAADFAAGAFPVAGVAEGDFAAPQARAVPVALGVAAGTAVFEGDAVFAAPAPQPMSPPSLSGDLAAGSVSTDRQRSMDVTVTRAKLCRCLVCGGSTCRPRPLALRN